MGVLCTLWLSGPAARVWRSAFDSVIVLVSDGDGDREKNREMRPSQPPLPVALALRRRLDNPGVNVRASLLALLFKLSELLAPAEASIMPLDGAGGKVGRRLLCVDCAESEPLLFWRRTGRGKTLVSS
jgi:hypothetical protein